MTTEPLAFSAAKADRVEYTAVTLELRLEATTEESPPLVELPQVTTEPSSLSAANAFVVEYTAVTPELRLEATAVEVPP